MNWRRMTLDPGMIGMRVLVKARLPIGRESHFCGVVRHYGGSYAVKSDDGSHHYFRKGTEYYYLNIDEVK